MSAQQFNRLMRRDEYDGIRDFLILHNHSTTRDEPLWQHCRRTAVPESPHYKIEQFTRTGRLMLQTDELFRDASWLSVLVGQNHLPHDYNPLLDAESTAVNAQVLSEQRSVLASAVTAMPMHFEILNRIVNTTSVQGA
jgi:tryptophan 7-halogenase